MGSVKPDTQGGRTLLKFVAVAVSAVILVFWLRRDAATTTREGEPKGASPSDRERGTAPDFWSKREPALATGDREPSAAVPADRSVATRENPAALRTPPTQDSGMVDPTTAQGPTPLSLPTCPERAPRDSSECTLPPDVDMNCGYHEGAESVVCRCKESGSDGMFWECRSDNEPSALTLCPESLPADRTSCDIAGQICFFGEAETARACECEPEVPHSWNCMSAVEYAARRH